MEALGAAAAIAQFVKLSFEASELARSVVSSFRHAPAEILELETKLQRLHCLLTQVASMCDELPEAQTRLPLLPNHHIGVLSMGMQSILDSLMRLKSVVIVPVGGSYSVGDRLRWATLDKKKARNLLQEAQMANDELSIMLQILTTRLSFLNQNSLAALNIGQSFIIRSLDDIKGMLSIDVTQLTAAVPGHTTAKSTTHKTTDNNDYPAQQQYEINPGYMLMQHNRNLSRKYLIANFGDTERPQTSVDEFYSTGGKLTLESKMRSQKAKLLFSMCIKLLGNHILRFELQAQLLCRLWRFDPSLRASLTIINVRPSDTPIFKACRNWNLQEVHYLLETGQAGINDTDGETGGLLEHVLLGNSRNLIYEKEFLDGGQLLLDYLLDQGCDPSITHARNVKALPAVLSAFSQGFRDATSNMVSRGADIVSFGNKVGGLFEVFGTDESQILWKFRLLQSMGYADWRLDGPANSLLYGACWSRNSDVSLFALEIAGLDPNQSGGLNRKPIGNAAQELWTEGIAILLQYGAEVNVNERDWNGTPLSRSTKRCGILTDTSHYLLRQCADPNLKDSRGSSVWTDTIGIHYDVEFGWNLKFSYIDFEGSVAHLLHHNSDPFESLVYDHTGSDGIRVTAWFTKMGNIKSSDIARLRSYGLSRKRLPYRQPDCFWDETHVPEDFSRKFETMDYDRSFDWTFQWDAAGVFSCSNVHSSTSELAVANPESLVLDDEHVEDLSKNMAQGEDSENENDEYITDEGNFVSHWAYKESQNHDSDHDADLRFALKGTSPGFFRNATAFYRHTATLQGQRQLSRWPMVRALCDGLQHAGYRVEMDDDGDLWYDCDDGDRYFDAWETQPAEERDDWLVDVCPICQNFDEYGLGHVLDIEHKAIEKVREYRRQVQEGKRKYF